MAVTVELENNELASLYFFMQRDEKCQTDPHMEKLLLKMESLVFSRLSIDEIESYRQKAAFEGFQEN